MLFRTSAAPAVAALCLAAAAPFAHASISVYTDQASFQAAIMAPATDTFDDLTDNVSDPSMTRSAGNYGYTVLANDSGFYSLGSSMDAWLSPLEAVPLAFSDFTGGVQAIGGYFFATDELGQPIANQPLNVTVFDADGGTNAMLPSQSQMTFLGFVSDSKINQLQVSMVDNGNAWATVNNLTLAQAMPPVPEPSTYALLLGGLAVVARVTARRRARG